MLLITLNQLSPTPIYRQIADGIRAEVAAGRVKAGDPLPSARELAGYLGINVNTVNKSYAILKDMGLIVIRPARGAIVSPNVRELFGSQSNEELLLKHVRSLLQEARLLGFSIEDVAALIEKAAKESFNQERQ